MRTAARVVIAVLGVLVWQLYASAAAADRGHSPKVVEAVLIFDTLAFSTTNVGDNFTTVGRVVSVDDQPFEGRLAFACQITDPAAGAGACLYYFHLPGGQVTGTGDVRDGIEFPITGGTGDYVGVSGTVLITHETEDGPRSAVFRLSKPVRGRNG